MHILCGKICSRPVATESRVGRFFRTDLGFLSVLEQFEILVLRIEHNIAVWGSVFIFRFLCIFYMGKMTKSDSQCCRSVDSESRVARFSRVELCFRSILEQFETLVQRIEYNPKTMSQFKLHVFFAYFI
jgi:hypothetical protein